MKFGNNDPCPCGSGKKFKRCHKGSIATFKSERFVISVKEAGVTYKLFSIRFYENKNNNTFAIQIYFPYTKNSNGILSTLTMPANVLRKDKLSMKVNGKVTSHNVKYSHWGDGKAHFSEAGKIFKTHDKQSFSLDDSVGHLFTVQAKGFHGFEKKDDSKEATYKRFDIDFDMVNKTIDSIKLTGWWYDASVMHIQGNRVPSKYFFKSESGDSYTCFALEAPPGHRLSGKVLLLCARREPFMTKEKGSHLLFLGGFDVKEIFNDISKDFNFLALKYPARNYKKLLNEIGSADFNENSII